MKLKRSLTPIVAGFFAAALLCVNASAQSPVIFDFNDGTALDQAGIGASMVVSNVSLTTIEIIGQDGSRASDGVDHKTNIFGSWNALGINDAIVSGDEYGSFDRHEAWVFNFDTDVNLISMDLAGVTSGSTGLQATISSSAFTADIIHNGGDTAGDIVDLQNVYVPAGTTITLTNTSAADATDSDWRVVSLTVLPATGDPLTIHGTPYTWLDSYYPGLTDPIDYENADTSDSDGDGMPTWKERIAGTNPTNTASVLQINSIEMDGTNCVVTWQSVTGKYYGVASDTNLVGSLNGLYTKANNIPGLASETSYTTSVSAASTGFYKIGIEKREIYLLIGQSNMAGRAPIETEDEAPIIGCDLFTDLGGWEVATNPLNKYSTIRKDLIYQLLGPGYGFARRLRELRPDVSLGLVVNARGGTSINEWAKGTAYYAAAIIRTQQALASGDNRLAGIIWHQGESNSSETNMVYMAKLTNLITNLRADLGEPDLPFIAGQLEQDDTTPTVKERPINDEILLLPTLVTNTAVATTEGLMTIDGTHFDSAGQRELGRRYADALFSLQQ